MAAEWLEHQTLEGHYMNGAGITVGHSEALGATIISVTNEEMARNPLARNWVEALIRARDTAVNERQLKLVKLMDRPSGGGTS